jgi:predicted DNA-binding transcriptional regulator AlpA
MRMQACANLLGISRHTLRRLIRADPTFPRFIELTPGIRLVRVRDVRAWLREKELSTVAQNAPIAPKRAK